MNLRITIAFLLLAGSAIAGCTSTPHLALMDNITCHYTFTGLESQGERDRVAAAIKKYAKDGVITSAPDPAAVSPEYVFTVDRLAELDQLHAELLFTDPAATPANLQQRLNSHGQTFSIHYDSANLGATIEMIVHFHVTPGVKLFYKPQGEGEKDITDMVGDSGDVKLLTSIRRGEEFISARIKAGNIDKFIRINIYTQQVESIPSNAY